MAQYVNIQEASHLLGLSVTALRRGVKAGRFAAVRVGNTPKGKLLFNLQDMAQILANEAYASIHNQEEEKKND